MSMASKVGSEGKGFPMSIEDSERSFREGVFQALENCQKSNTMIKIFGERLMCDDPLKGHLRTFDMYPKRCVLTLLHIIQKSISKSIPRCTILYGNIDENGDYEINLKWPMFNNSGWLSLIITEEDVQLSMPQAPNDPTTDKPLLFGHHIEGLETIEAYILRLAIKHEL